NPDHPKISRVSDSSLNVPFAFHPPLRESRIVGPLSDLLGDEPRRIRMPWIQEEIGLFRNHDGRNLCHERLERLRPLSAPLKRNQPRRLGVPAHMSGRI